ncbi:MAG: hypothetical protein IJX81_05685 [Clostridia bacterium]|nr:hypothetical protein [Clostridia bacterium]
MIQIKEVLTIAAELLGLGTKFSESLISATEEGTELQKKLLKSFYLAESEVALDYLPLVAEDDVESSTGTVYFSELSKYPARIIKVAGEDGERLFFEVYSKYIKTLPVKATVTYAYAPDEKGIAESAEAHPAANARMLAYATAEKYCLIEGLYEEAGVWEAKFKEAVKAARKAAPTKVIRSRRWV